MTGALPAPKPDFSHVFGETLSQLADEDPTVVAITAAMQTGTGLTTFAERHPDRLYDVGIAEGHAITMASGMAKQGLKPVAAIYSSFCSARMICSSTTHPAAAASGARRRPCRHRRQ